jgi:hypothetical protein
MANQHPRSYSSDVASYASAGTSVLTAIVHGYMQYAQTREIETTKRASIASQREIALTRLAAQREQAMVFFDKTFAERRDTIAQLFVRIDQGIESGNLEALSMYLSSIIAILQSDPSHGFASFCKSLDEDDTVIDMQ